MRKKLFLFLVCLIVGIGLATAQTTRITGVVVSAEDGQPIVGASIMVKGTSLGTVTDVNGAFYLNVPGSAKTLTVSYIGMITSNVPIRVGKMNISLTSDTKELGEVIVVGYGTQRREAKTGSIVSVSASQIADIPASSLDKMLSGKMAGVQITTSTGQPGSGSSIRIRGTSSINAGNEPLYVVDGIPVMSGDQSGFTNTNNAIAMINPDDIESITVLKDAASASVYGSRAANGVLLITTKSGKDGKSRIGVRAKLGFSCLANDNNFGVMTGEQLLGYQRQAITNAGLDPDDPTGTYYRPYELLTRPLTNWVDEFTRLGKLQEYEITLSGGSARTKYYSSFSFHDNQGIYYGVGFKRIQGRINVDHELNAKWTTGARVNVGYMYNQDVPMQDLYYANPAFAGLMILPWTPARNADGSYNSAIPENSNSNPRATAAYDEQWEKQYRFNGSMYLQWKPAKGLTVKSTNAAEMTFNEGRRYWDPRAHSDQSGTGTLQTTQIQYRLLTTSNQITYEGITNKHSYRAVLGQEANQTYYWYDYQSSKNLNSAIPYHVAGNSTNDLDYNNYTYSLMSFFGILDYNYDSRYYVQASARYDGCSKFGENNKWGLFYSVGLSWNMHNEAFMKNADWLQTMKFRLSYGLNGNNNITNYQQYGTYTSSTYNGLTGMRPSTPSNKNLSWEKNTSWNAGVDFRVMKRFSGSLDLYTRKTSDMLLYKNQSYTSGFGSVLQNVGSMRNSGIEFQLDANVIDTKDWKWNVGFNISHNQSKILKLADDQMMDYVLPDLSIESRLKHIVGEKLFTFYLKDYYGVNPVNGEALWRTSDGKLSNNYNDAAYVKAGSPEPTYTGGINTTLSWKNISLSVVGEFKGGNKIIIIENRYMASDGNRMSNNQAKRELNYWKKPGDTGCNPKPIAGKTDNSYATASTRWLENGGYFRIKDVTLAYDVPSTYLKHVGLSALKIYGSGLNVYTFHKVNFWDPERGVDGMGYGVYPVTKTFVLGLDLSF
jgi:TonB-linked SusC/RagA family outer membrane protein